MIIGLHNTFSGLEPKHWWLKPFNFIAKCQNSNILETYESLLKDGFDICVDLRVYYPSEFPFKEGIAHGAMSYKGDRELIYDTLNKLSTLCIKYNKELYVRVILEKKGKNVAYESLFSFFCIKLEEDFPNIIFYGGVYKPTWKLIHNFKNKLELNTIQYVGSMAKDARWYEKFIPYLYAKRKNLDNIMKITDESKIYLFDFFDNVYSKNKS